MTIEGVNPGSERLRPPAGLQVTGLVRCYGARRALDGMNLSVEPGQIMGFVGANGAGKSTCMRVIVGVLESEAGTIRWNGVAVDAGVRRRFGYMPEERGLYPRMTVWGHLLFLARLHGYNSSQAGALAQNWIQRLDLSAHARRRIETLSLGNQQRIQLAAALVHRPDLVVLDEPFSGLDPVGVDHLCQVLREQAGQGVAVLFSSHQLELIERICHSVTVLREGRDVVSGAVDSLRADGPVTIILRTAAPVARALVNLGHLVSVRQSFGSNDDALRIEVDSEGDAQEVLRAAMAAGPVLHFAVNRPTLSELFREVLVS